MTRTIRMENGTEVIMIGSVPTSRAQVEKPVISTSTVKPAPRPQKKAEEGKNEAPK